MRVAAVIATSLLIASCATGGRLLEYGYELADAEFKSAFGPYSVYVHPTQNTLLLQPKIGKISRPYDTPLSVWRQVAEEFVRPAGCGISRVEALAVKGASWEAWYVCPAGVDLRSLIDQQRSDLRDGKPLHR